MVNLWKFPDGANRSRRKRIIQKFIKKKNYCLVFYIFGHLLYSSKKKNETMIKSYFKM